MSTKSAIEKLGEMQNRPEMNHQMNVPLFYVLREIIVELGRDDTSEHSPVVFQILKDCERRLDRLECLAGNQTVLGKDTWNGDKLDGVCPEAKEQRFGDVCKVCGFQKALNYCTDKCYSQDKQADLSDEEISAFYQGNPKPSAKVEPSSVTGEAMACPKCGFFFYSFPDGSRGECKCNNKPSVKVELYQCENPKCICHLSQKHLHKQSEKVEPTITIRADVAERFIKCEQIGGQMLEDAIEEVASDFCLKLQQLKKSLGNA